MLSFNNPVKSNLKYLLIGVSEKELQERYKTAGVELIRKLDLTTFVISSRLPMAVSNNLIYLQPLGAGVYKVGDLGYLQPTVNNIPEKPLRVFDLEEGGQYSIYENLQQMGNRI